MKIRFQVFLALLLLLALPTVLQAQFSFTTNDGAITITGYIGSDGEVSIPSTINGWPVRNVASRALFYCTAMTSISIPDGVISIGDRAFAYCPNLTNAYISSSVVNLGDRTFDECFSLVDISVDALNAAYSSAGGVLFDKTQTTLLQYPPAKAGAYAIPDSVTSLAFEAFFDCNLLTNISFGNALTNTGDGPFIGCGSLAEITVSPANPAFSSAAGVLFNKNKTALVECPMRIAGNYTIPDSVTSIDAYAFAQCIDLTNVTIPNSVTNIGDDAFWICWSLTSITIPNNVTSIGNWAF